MATGDDGYIKIAEYTSTTSPFTFSSLGGSGIAGLRIVASLRHANSGLEWLGMRFNSSSGNYHQVVYRTFQNGSVSHGYQPAYGYNNKTQAYMYNCAPGSNNQYFFTPFVFDVYGSAPNAISGYNMGHWHAYESQSGASNHPRTMLGTYQMEDVASLSSIYIFNGGYANWQPGTIFSLYGFGRADDNELFSASG